MWSVSSPMWAEEIVGEIGDIAALGHIRQKLVSGA